MVIFFPLRDLGTMRYSTPSGAPSPESLGVERSFFKDSRTGLSLGLGFVGRGVSRLSFSAARPSEEDRRSATFTLR